MHNVKPWVNGPLELVRHAEGHLKGGSGTDERLAFICRPLRLWRVRKR